MSSQDPYNAPQPAAGNDRRESRAQEQGYGNHSGGGTQNGYAQQQGHGGPGDGQQQGYGAPAYGDRSGHGQPPSYGGPSYGGPGYGGPAHAGGAYGGYQGAPHQPGTQPGVSVGFVDAVKRFYAKYAQFSGRASRSEYWWVALYLGGIYFLLSIMSATAGTNSFGEPNGFGALISILLFIFMLGHIVPSIAIGVRRLHDVNLSGWFYLLSLIPFVGGLVLIVLMVLPPKPEGARFDR